MTVRPASAVGILTLGLLLFPSASAAQGAVQRTAVTYTRVRVVKPFSRSGKIKRGDHVVASGKGVCVSASIASPRWDAFRCVLKKRTYDPCFRSPDGRRVACPVSLPPKKLVIIQLTKPLPAANPGYAAPWALALGNGSKCRFDTGTTFIEQGLRANFACSNPGGWAFGSVSESVKPWRINFGAPPGYQFQWMAVRIAWF